MNKYAYFFSKLLLFVALFFSVEIQCAEIDFDDPPKTIHQITPSLSYGTKFELEFELRHNDDLESGSSDNFEVLEPSADLAITYEPADWVYAFTQISFDQPIKINNTHNSSSGESQLEISRAYLYFDQVVDGLALQIGRQRIKDEREWWFDENLDALRLFYRYQNLGLQFSVSREELIGADLLNEDNQDEINNYFLSAHYLFDIDVQLNGYLLFLDDHSKRKRDRLYLGLQATGKLTKRVKFWMDSAGLLGRNDNRDYRAYAFDIGAIFAPKINWSPSLTLAVAFGSGDGDSSDGVDEIFRQTGYEDNNAKFNGVTKFKYYGELLDPELSNLWVLTAGLGIKPSKKSSIDLVYHYYRQHRLDDRLRADIEIDPDGKNKELGHELDVIVGLKKFKGFNTELVFGVFFPGQAYSGNADNALFSKVEFSYRY